MTTVGLLYPGHSAEGDYPRIEALLTGVNVPIVHTDIGEDAHRVDALLEMGAPARLAAGTEELRLSGAESVVWACTSGSFVHGWEGAHEQIRGLAVTAGLPASSTSFAFVHAVREVGARRVAVAATYPEDVTELFVRFLEAAGIEVVAARAGGVVTAAEVATWGPERVLELVRAADRPGAEAVLVPDTALHTVGCLPELEAAVGKPVLTANQVTVWEGLRLAERRGAWSTELGALFARKERDGEVGERAGE
ncbi:decarboxylase [Streptomyces sp. WAC05374]|uniref:maleate cis-trans isomerase family protein n=1 Tax=Streptomyces sp. WAC05374 TaxID=2487420 RepID=UPI000F894D3D|nr:aspartate/glutamate racemase family protein [Streptomyces sp. WAC05374]RST12203.1 decarboxylase [Streptomyces sp. WAC05374]TDF44290.1 decarboxylase [Streptomyces sp. WAC05374]TDF53780.1 decarboxylase [Streptomyces sp. WAC05374]TDF58613.1 decarboxylase [Streptomyces sp. WAC05374]